MHLINISRSLGALLALITSALLLVIWNDASVKQITKRQLLTAPTLILKSFGAVNVSHLHGPHDFSLEHTHTHVIDKRALTLSDAACKGRKLLGQIDEVHVNLRKPGDELPATAIDNGWSKEGIPRAVPEGLVDAFKAIGKSIEGVGEREPEYSDVTVVDLVQNKDFRNKKNKKTTAIPEKDNKRAHFEVYYIPKWLAVISTDTRSPTYQLQQVNPKLKPNQIDDLVPPLNRQSDVMWTVWKTVAEKANTDPNSLRYICRTGISNDDTKDVMTEIFNRRPQGKSFEWPGLTFTVDQEEAQALLGTPNGLATAYIMLDRGKQLGRRRLKVTIFASSIEPASEYRMLWDMGPDIPPEVPPLDLPGATFDVMFTPSATALAARAAATTKA
ncbi:MAG: hypothetical protein Q9186_000162 [Xanthomendoza sp. 1 TL-2023]